MKEIIKAKKILLKKDPTLKDLFSRHKKLDFEPKLERSPYESLVRAIAHQQLHGKAAETILGRFTGLFSHKPFPECTDILSLSPDKIRACGFSQSKVKSIHDIARHTEKGLVPDKAKILKMSNQEIVESLTQIYGVGRWTVEMLLIFQLGRLDVWPVDDFGIRRGFQIWKKKRKFPTAKDLKPMSTKWEPYQTVVSLYLWKEADLAKLK
jgi:3-methyladenine DNA glycosylase/8-oxoguanine DNA glycosylase